MASCTRTNKPSPVILNQSLMLRLRNWPGTDTKSALFLDPLLRVQTRKRRDESRRGTPRACATVLGKGREKGISIPVFLRWQNLSAMS
jgi:hypothetical protein